MIACALVGAAALTGAATQGSLTALVLVVELTVGSSGLLEPLPVATALARAVARQVDGWSICTARLSRREPTLMT